MDKKNINDLLNEFNFVVPEIQREYVWGANKNKRVLSQFLKDLDHKLGQGDANIGFLYSYESGTEHYLIDGQQRYTTILLLCYYLAALEGNDSRLQFVDRLKFDQNVQAFAYRVRSNTETFLKTLFKSGVTDRKYVSDQTWYKSEYENDTTILSMIGALEVFGDVMNECKHITLTKILNNVFFWYFDVDMTSQGEELYITMNSRGEKLTDSEQIKPRLLKKAGSQKEYYGKVWDNWEEFFYNKNRRGNRDISMIDMAMSNVIRIVLELKTCHEHDRLNPVEDAESITIEDVAEYMEALMYIAHLENGNYKTEIERLYGDSKEDGDFYVLKALLTERLKGQDDSNEYLRVYKTVRNHVRRNKLKNLAFLGFLKKYIKVPSSWYEYIIEQGDESKTVFNGHELEKIQICHVLGASAETAIWNAQARPFWNGEIKSLLNWAKNEDEVFCLDSFVRLIQCFNLLFDKKKDDGWTSDNVRQALVVRLTYYPLDGCFFGYTSEQWKQIMKNNPTDFKNFLNEFVGMDASARDTHIAEIKMSYPETPENQWAEFVHHDYILEYCNTKRVQYRDEYGIECVQNAYKQPYSVKNMHLSHYLKYHLKDFVPLSQGWWSWTDLSGWKSVVKLGKSVWPIHIWIQYRKDKGECYEVTLNTTDYTLQGDEKSMIQGLGFEYDEEKQLWQMLAPLDIPQLMAVIIPCFSIKKGSE